MIDAAGHISDIDDLYDLTVRTYSFFEINSFTC
jgi:hypothetical protein